ncbi:MAG: hypothetical protein KGN79_06135 [Acidobacteriota bacterium]|nr:hypothetical protein [Acidobacteriota bacterium]
MQTLLRIVRSIAGPVGALMIVMGGIWILQGLNLAWGILARSFMQNDRHWAVYGVLLTAAGLVLVLWSYIRPRRHQDNVH